MTRLKQFLALAGLTTVEVLRQPVSLLITITAIVLMGLSPLFLLHNFGEAGKIVRDAAMAVHMLLGSMLAAYAACSVMAREIRSGTASAILSKPVDRGLFYIAKFAGVIAVILFFSVCATAGTLLSEKACEKFYENGRVVGYFTDQTTGALLLLCPALACIIGAAMNLVRKRPFVTAALKALCALLLLLLAGACFLNENGSLQSFFPLFDFRLVNASVLIFTGIAVIAALAMLLSVRLNSVQAMSVLCALFIAGWMSQYFFGAHADSSVVCAVLYGLLPDWQHFWKGDALSGNGVIKASYVLNAAVYAVLYIAGLLAGGVAIFGNSELK